MQRRDLLKGLAAGGVGFAASRSPVRRLVELVPPEHRIKSYEETFKTTACDLCPAGCGLRVRMVDQQAVGLSGHPLDPISSGGLCPRGLALLDQYYHPDRLKKPLRRVGKRGAGSFEVVEWDEAIDAIATKMKGLAGDRVVFFDGRPEGFHHLLIDRFMRHIGSPHHITDRFDGAFPVACEMMLGRRFLPAYEPEDLDLIVSVSEPFLDHSASPAYHASQYAKFRRNRVRRGQLLLFDDSGGITSHKADEAHFVRPGTHAAVLLALCNVVVRFGWYDKAVVRERVKGFEAWSDKVLDRFTPESVEAETGVQSEVFYETARRLAETDRKVVIAGPHAMTGPGGVQAAMAMLALNLLVGALDRDLHLLEPLERMLDLDPPPPAAPATGNTLGSGVVPLPGAEAWCLPEAVAADGTSVSALFLYASDPIGSQPGRNRWKAALDELPLVVSFSQFLDETSRHADFVLPESHCFERYQELLHPAVSRVRRISICQPLWEEPRFDTRHPGDILLELGRRLGDKGAEVFPWVDYPEYLDACLGALYEMGTGTVLVEAEKLRPQVALEERGFWQDVHGDPDTFLDAVYESGGWVDVPHVTGQWQRLVHTPSGRIEFASSVMKSAVEQFLSASKKSLADLGLSGLEETYFMPEAVTRGLSGHVGKAVWIMVRDGRSAAELHSWWEIVGMHNYLQWTMWAEAGAPAGSQTEMLTRHSVRFKLDDRPLELPVVFHAGQPSHLLTLPMGFPEGRSCKTPLPSGYDLAGRMAYQPDPLTGLPSLYMKLQEVAFSGHDGGEG